MSTLTRHSDNFLEIEMWTDLKNHNFNSLSQFDAIYIGGGNTFNLLKALHDSNFIEALINYIYQGGTVYGGSAGAIIIVGSGLVY